MNLNKQIANNINNIFIKHNIHEKIHHSDIIVLDNIICDNLFQNKSNFSNIIIKNIWPPIKEREVYHYTNQKATESILKSETFRLCNIAKNYSFNEVEAFCKNHNLTYPLKRDENNIPNYKKDIMPNTFYASFTDVENPNIHIADNYLWRQFSKQNGVRLKLKISAKNEDFREMKYEEIKGKPIELYNDIISLIENQYNKKFAIKGLSRFVSFYLPIKFKEETETRLLFRTWSNTDKYIIGDQNKIEETYIEIPLNKDNFTTYKIEITEIQSDKELIIPDKYKHLLSNRNV